ncbi:MAG: DUF1778 domain-containing protein [Pseudomonadota bacterium]
MNVNFIGRQREETAKIEHNQLMKEEKMIILSHWEWERLMALQENPPKANEKLKQLMQRKHPLIGFL